MFENKKIVVLGLARSGIAASKFLKKRGCDVIVNDRVSSYDKAILDELDSLGIKVVLGSHPDSLIDSSVDYLIKNTGVPIDHKYVLKCN